MNKASGSQDKDWKIKYWEPLDKNSPSVFGEGYRIVLNHTEGSDPTLKVYDASGKKIANFITNCICENKKVSDCYKLLSFQTFGGGHTWIISFIYQTLTNKNDHFIVSLDPDDTFEGEIPKDDIGDFSNHTGGSGGGYFPY